MSYPPSKPWPKWYQPPARRGFLPADIVRAVAADFDLTYAEVTGNGRQRPLVEARSVAARILRARGMSYPRIGHFIGGRDHSTVMNLVDKFPVYARMNAIVESSYAARRVEFGA